MSLLEKDHFLLGLFGPNCSSGICATTIPDRWANSWENNVRLAQMVDSAGLDFILPIARWVGFGGETNFNGDVLDPLTYAAGLLALTKNLHIMITLHTGFHNPVVAAKQIATVNEIGSGRVGVNIVAGWNRPEYEALGIKMPDHSERYKYSQEWFEIVQKVWKEEEFFDFAGEYWNLKNVLGAPRPRRRPTIVNAGGSGEGKAFAVRNADLLFTGASDLEKSKGEVEELKAKGEAQGRTIGVVTPIMVICRPTDEEAQAFYRYYGEEHMDWVAAQRVVEGLIANSHTYPPEVMEKLKRSFGNSFGSYTIVGTPKHVASEILRVKEAGFKGAALGFVDYLKEFEYFRDEVMPLLVEGGIRPAVQ